MKSSLALAAAVSVLALLSGCAAPDASGSSGRVASTDAGQQDVVCFYEAPTGTNRKVRRCMSKEEYARSMETAQRTASEIRTPPPRPQ